MTQIDPTYVGAHEFGVLRIYSINVPAGDIEAFTTNHREFFAGEPEPDYWALKDWLGADTLNAEHINIIDIADLSDMPFTTYLIDGYDVTDEDIEAHRTTLDALGGHLAIITSAAFGGVEQDLKANTDALKRDNTFLIHAATLRQSRANITFRPLPDESAKGPVEDLPQKKKPSDAAMGGRVATIALLVMGLLVWVMIRVAG